MKIVCDTCGMKYSIDDNRVSGKAFKIRCKKCSRDIILRGAPAPVAAPVPDAEPVPNAGVWHVVLGGTQVGPIELAEVHRLRAAGKLDDGSLIWREGFDDWREAGTIDELRDVVRSPVEAAPELAAGPAPARPALRSERNESSVLFTLGNLAKLAAAPSTASPSTGSEGSGLLDIRSLARSLAPVPAHAPAERGSFDDLPVWAPVSFVEPMMLVPVAPRGRDRRLVWALAAAIGMLATVAAILVVIVVHGNATPVHAAVMPAGSATPTSAAPPTASPARLTSAPVPAPPTVIAQAAPTAAPPSVAQATPAATTEPRATQPALAAAAEPRAAQPAPTAAAEPRAAQPAPTAAAPLARTAPAAPHRASVHAPATPRSGTTPAPLQPARSAESCSEVTCLVSGYADKCCEIYRDRASGTAASSPSAPQLPEGLDRSAAAAGIAQIDTSGCHDQSPAHGDVTASIKVSPAGAVTAVTVKSSPDAALSACVTAAARKVSFARTQHGGSFAYVWRF